MQIYLVTPQSVSTDFAAQFAAAMNTGTVAAVLIRQSADTVSEYEELVAELSPLAQSRDIAVLLDNRPELVRPLGADGVHMTGGIKEFNEASKAVKPEFILGAGDVNSKHEAMLRGEAGADYLLFGNLDGRSTTEDREHAEWWSEMFEVPAAFAVFDVPIADIDAPDCEFIVLEGNVWNAPEGAAAALELAHKRFDAE